MKRFRKGMLAFLFVVLIVGCICSGCSLLGHEHSIEIVSREEATCTESGWTEGKICLTCGKTVVEQKKIPALGHDTVSIGTSKPATCTESGLTAGKKCSRCERVIEEPTVIPAGHNYVETEKIPATCMETGLTAGKYCDKCGYVLVAQREISALGHSIVEEKEQPATCTKSGKTAGKYCERCGEVFVTQKEIRALGHNIVNTKEQPATCTKSGKSAGEYCDRCNEVFSDQKVIPALGHDLVDHEEKQATHTQSGWEAYQSCSRCDYSTYKEIPANKDHAYYYHSCVYCGKADWYTLNPEREQVVDRVYYRDSGSVYITYYIGSIDNIPIEVADGTLQLYSGDKLIISKTSGATTEKGIEREVSESLSASVSVSASVGGEIGAEASAYGFSVKASENYELCTTETFGYQLTSSYSAAIKYIQSVSGTIELDRTAKYDGLYRSVLFVNADIYCIVKYDVNIGNYGIEYISKICNSGTCYGLEYTKNNKFDEPKSGQLVFDRSESLIKNDIKTVVAEAGTGTQNDPYRIYAVSDFNLVRQNPSSHFVLANDIDLSGYAWSPIGKFTGTIDGANHTISNMRIDNKLVSESSSIYRCGFVSTLDNGGTIKNITFTNAKISASSGDSGMKELDVAFIVGRIEDGSVLNCTVKNSMVDNATLGYKGDNNILVRVGAIAGIAKNSTVKDCVVENNTLRGNAAMNGGSHSTIASCFVGGAFGGIWNGTNTMSNIVVKNNNVNANSYCYWTKEYSSAGGFVGEIESGYCSLTNITVDSNTVTYSFTEYKDILGNSNRDAVGKKGSFAGIKSSSATVTFSNCKAINSNGLGLGEGISSNNVQKVS